MAKQHNKHKSLTDPVEEQLGAKDGDLEKSFDPSNLQDQGDNLRMDEIGAVREIRTQPPHPFDGYQLARKVPVDEPYKDPETRKMTQLMVSATYLVLMAPNEEPTPDRSNIGKTIYVGAKPGEGGNPAKHKPKVVDLQTSHTRCILGRSADANYSVVFDRKVKVAGTKFNAAIIPQHSVRAQVCFTLNSDKEKLVPDRRYLLADKDQAERLFKLASACHWQTTKHEHNAQVFDAAKDHAPVGLVPDEGEA